MVLTGRRSGLPGRGCRVLACLLGGRVVMVVVIVEGGGCDAAQDIGVHGVAPVVGGRQGLGASLASCRWWLIPGLTG